MKLYNKKINRLERLDDYRRTSNLTTSSIGNFEIEVSPKALKKIKSLSKKITFRLEHDFGIDDSSKERYWVRLNNECPNKKTDFNYNAYGEVLPFQHNGDNEWGITIKFEHIDPSCKWSQLNALVEMIAIGIDKRYGNDCGFEKRWDTDLINIYFINEK